MHLNRVTPPWVDGKFASQVSNDYQAFTHRCETTVVARFPRYGGGETRQSDLEVEILWPDVEIILQKFCKADHPQAVAIREARKLSAAINKNPAHAPNH
jgi:hypothetical protein